MFYKIRGGGQDHVWPSAPDEPVNRSSSEQINFRGNFALLGMGLPVLVLLRLGGGLVILHNIYS